MKWFLLSITLFLTACSSKQNTTTLYALPNSEPGLKGFSHVEIIIPDYLDGPGLVYRTSDTELFITRYHLWADTVTSMVTSYYQAGVGDLPFDEALSLTIVFERFNGSYSGVAEIKGNWSISGEDRKVLLEDNFDIQTPLSEEGYDAMVRALAASLDKLLVSIELSL
ncbi:ABC-type transport auxiliary lipoprotein family protein [Agarivorans albus]|uniref:PqiC family protein n=1 Tax=Agarivorans sp. JK6 TaxID=2997426 RepID=UPI0037E6C7DB